MSDLLQARRARAKFASPQSMRLMSQTKQFIVEHRHLYLQGPNSLDALPNTIKLEILETLGALEENDDAFELQCKILLLLMNSAMTAFCFPLGMVELRNKTAAMSLWNHLLALRPRNLQTLVLIASPKNPDPNKWNISLLLKESIFKFNHLQVLKIGGFQCQNIHLCLIARKLPHLRVLDLALCPDFVTKRGFEALSKLQSLREFIFSGSGEFNMNKAMLWCFQYLPQLHVAGFKPDLDGDEFTLQDYGEILKNAFRRVILIRNVTLKLHFLVLNHNDDDDDVLLEEGIALPELQMMCVIRPGNVARIDFDQFPHLSELSLIDVINNPGLHTALESVGQRLSKLKLHITDLHLDTVLQLCPNLSELIVETTHLFPQQSQPLPLLNLQQVQIKFALDVTLTDPLLQLLRLAPNLRSFSIELPNTNFNFVPQFVDLARERSCMQKLQSMKFRILTSRFTTHSEARKQWYRDMLEGCANYLDHLHTLNVIFSICYDHLNVVSFFNV